MTGHTMPFGKHKGTPVSELPADYLRWLSENVELREPLASTVRARIDELEGRTTAVMGPVNLRAIRRKYAQQYHPDRGEGNLLVMSVVNQLIDELAEVMQCQS